LAGLIWSGQTSRAQVLDDNNKDAVRVTVTMNPDGSRTTYEYDNQNHRATAITNDPDGKMRGKIRYEIDDAGRFANGTIFSADGKFRFKSIYKYDNAGRLSEETHLNEKGGLINKLVYHYDASGKATGYSVYDAAGKLMGNSATPTPPPKGPAKIVR
jgi:YD repeat-containing protein